MRSRPDEGGGGGELGTAVATSTRRGDGRRGGGRGRGIGRRGLVGRVEAGGKVRGIVLPIQRMPRPNFANSDQGSEVSFTPLWTHGDKRRGERGKGGTAIHGDGEEGVGSTDL